MTLYKKPPKRAVFCCKKLEFVQFAQKFGRPQTYVAGDI